MSDSKVNKWKQTGRIFLWQYMDNKKYYPGWHFTADKKACLSLVSLIDLMKTAEWSSSTILKISPPSYEILKVPNNIGGNARWISVDTFKLKYLKEQMKSNYWFDSLDPKMNQMTLIFGSKFAEDFQRGIADVYMGKGDYAINHSLNHGKNNNQFWFWWMKN